jgi:hypothetical protein
MTKLNDLVHSIQGNDGYKPEYGLTKREYFAATNSSITWQDAAKNAEAFYERTATIGEVAMYLAEMKKAAADALITALNTNP